MFRSSLVRTTRQARYLHVTTPVRYSIVDGVKETLNKANKVTGEFLATTIETAESAPTAAENVADKANKKTGEVLADGIEKAQNLSSKAPDASEAADKVGQAADTVNKKTGETLAKGIDEVEKVTDTHKRRVNNNAKGYKDLQDKGSKAESEQVRPDDGL